MASVSHGRKKISSVLQRFHSQVRNTEKDGVDANLGSSLICHMHSEALLTWGMDGNSN